MNGNKITLESLKSAAVGSTFDDGDDDIWAKNGEGTWSVPRILSYNSGTRYKHWSSERVLEAYSDAGVWRNFFPENPRPEDQVIRKADLVQWMRDVRPAANNDAGKVREMVYRELIDNFDLPPIDVEQEMIITLRIPVQNLDPTGDTIEMGKETLDELDASVTGYVSAVEIVKKSR